MSREGDGELCRFKQGRSSRALESGEVGDRSIYGFLHFWWPACKVLTFSLAVDRPFLQPMAAYTAPIIFSLPNCWLVLNVWSVKTPSLVDAAANGEQANWWDYKTLKTQGYKFKRVLIRLSVVLRHHAALLEIRTMVKWIGRGAKVPCSKNMVGHSEVA